MISTIHDFSEKLSILEKLFEFFRTTVQRFKTLKNERYLINYFDIVNQ